MQEQQEPIQADEPMQEIDEQDLAEVGGGTVGIWFY
jgi:hypothetical protein